MKTILMTLVLTAVLAGCGAGDSSNLSTPQSQPAAADAGAPTNPHPDAGTPAGQPDAGPATISVTGVILGADRQPAANVAVVIGGQAPVNSDANGRFTFSNVVPPYDVTLVDNVNNIAVVYEGLTRPDPTLLRFGAGATPIASASAAGAITNMSAATYFDARAGFVSDVVDAVVDGSSGSYQLPLQWAGASAASGSLWAWEVDLDAAGLPTAYRFGTKPLTLSSGGSFTGQDLGLLAVGTSNLAGYVSPAAGYSILSKDVVLSFNGRTLDQIQDVSTSSGFSYLAPSFPGVGVAITATALKPNIAAVIETVPVTGASVNVTIPAGPEAILPSDKASGIDTSTVFSWTPAQNATHLVRFAPVAGGPQFFVVTAKGSATIPNLRSIGLGLPSSASYQWAVYSLSPFGTVDAFATRTLVDTLTGRATSAWGYGQTSGRSFTTTP